MEAREAQGAALDGRGKRAHLCGMSLDLAPVLALLRREIPELAGVYLFGSVAEERDNAASDVDIAIYAGRPLPRARVIELQLALSETLKREVDLVELAAAPTILQVEAIQGRLLDAPDPLALGLFEVRVMRDYQDLKARIAEMDADAVRRGRVYG